MLKKSKVLVIVSLMVLMCACGYAPYIEPISGPTARARFAASNIKGPQYVQVVQCTGPKCTVSGTEPGVLIGVLKEGKARPDKIKKLNMPGGDIFSSQGIFTEVSIPAEEIFKGYFMWWEMSYTCLLIYDFMPRQGKDYEITYIRESYGCGMSITELSLDASGSVARIPVDFQLHKNK